MDSAVAAVVGSLGGAFIGVPMGYFVERFLKRPRLRVTRGKIAYEDLFSIPADVQQRMQKYGLFVRHVELLVQWSLRQRLAANQFKREELQILHEIGTRFRDEQAVRNVQLEIHLTKAKSGNLGPEAIAELLGEYYDNFAGNLSLDYRTDSATAAERAVVLIQSRLADMEVTKEWLEAFLRSIRGVVRDGSRRSPEPGRVAQSERIAVHIEIANYGSQDAIISTEARLVVDAKQLRLSLATPTRPWESEGDWWSPNQLLIMARRPLALHYVVDLLLNASDDISRLREDLKRGAAVEFRALGIGGGVATRHSFRGTLPEPGA